MRQTTTRYALCSLLIAIGMGIVGLLALPTNAAAPPTITISDTVLVSDVDRLGMNLGKHDQFGASQLLKNIVPNPGFESGEHAMMFHILESNGQDVLMENWSDQPAGYWNGGRYDIISGSQSGTNGTVQNFGATNDSTGSSRRFFTIDGTTPPNPTDQNFDIMMVRKEVSGYYGGLVSGSADIAEKRPGSPGAQSLKLEPASSQYTPSWRHVMDTWYRDADRTANKLVLGDGSWHFEIWAKAETAGENLYVRFARDGEAVFLQEQVPLTTAWQKIEFDFTVAPGTDPDLDYDPTAGVTHPALQLALLLDQGSSAVWVDDIVMERTDTPNPTVFSSNLVQTLIDMQPGVLRDWGLQLGSSLDNQLAIPHARQTTTYKHQNTTPKDFHYSIHEFLELSQYIDSDPWYVIPPTFTADELSNLMIYLGGAAGTHPYADLRANLGQTEPWTDVFDTIHLEYGNEVWGSGYTNSDPFAGATVRGGEAAGRITSSRYDILRASPQYSSSKFNFVIGGQNNVPSTNESIENNATAHDQIGLAPYYGNVNNWTTDEALYYPLFALAHEAVDIGKVAQAQDIVDAAGQGTSLAIYEINLHGHTGDANFPIDVRNDLVTGQGAGMSLPYHMLMYMREMGITAQAMWRLSDYSTEVTRYSNGVTSGTGDYVRLFGGLVDIDAGANKRPTLLSLELVNKAIQGNMISTSQSGESAFTLPKQNGMQENVDMTYVNSFAFKDGDNYSIVLFNISLDQTFNVDLVAPGAPGGAISMRSIVADSIYADNETTENVNITNHSLSGLTGIPLPPHSLHVISWSTDPNAQPTPSPTALPVNTSIPTDTPIPTEPPATAIPTATPTPQPNATATITAPSPAVTVTPTITSTNAATPQTTATVVITPTPTLEGTPCPLVGAWPDGCVPVVAPGDGSSGTPCPPVDAWPDGCIPTTYTPTPTATATTEATPLGVDGVDSDASGDNHIFLPMTMVAAMTTVTAASIVKPSQQ